MGDGRPDVAPRGPVLVDGHLALVVDATVAGLRGRGVDARAYSCGASGVLPPADACFLVLLVPGRAESAVRAGRAAAGTGLVWGAVVEAPSAAVADALVDTGAAWVLSAGAGLGAVLAALDRAARRTTATAVPAPGPRSSPAVRLASLGPQERAVLDAMAEGRSVPETARVLAATHATVRAHRRSICTKLGVRSQLAAVALLLRQEVEDEPALPAPRVPGPAAAFASDPAEPVV